VALFEYLDGEKKRLTHEINRLAMTKTYASQVKLLQSVPGIGILSAMEILVEIVDISRFHTADQLASYLGVTPSQYSSGERIRMGHITHAGNARIRTTIVEASWLLIGKDLSMRYKYEKIKYRRGGKRAIVAIARTLSARITRMLLDQVPYKTELCKAA
jgi:transposase